MTSSSAETETPVRAPGACIEVRDAEWMVRTCTLTPRDGFKITGVGVSEFVRDEDAVFFTGIDGVVQLRPEDTRLVADTSSAFARSRLYLESVLRRTPLPQSEPRPGAGRPVPPRPAHLPAAPGGTWLAGLAADRGRREPGRSQKNGIGLKETYGVAVCGTAVRSGS